MDDQDMHIESEGYALSGKIMLSAIIILFVVIIFMVGLHLYARWYLIRLRRHQLERRRQRRGGPAHIVIYADNHRPGTAVDRGLEPAVLSSLPVFFHSAEVEAEQPLLECAVCLSEFEEKEIVRLLPKCNHSFHIECIDMWFHSHSTCPLCRSPVEVVVNRVESEVVVTEPVELCTTYQECENGGTSTTLFGSVRKGLEVKIEIPTTRIHFENELTQSLPASRLLSRIISMGKKSPRGSGEATPCGAGTSRAAAELELESGLCESSRVELRHLDEFKTQRKER